MSNTAAYEATEATTTSVQTYGASYSTSNVQVHKSFDFSNVGMPNASAFKQYHQTRLYIQGFRGMLEAGDQVASSTDTYLLSANLPESFSYKVGSQWAQPFAAFGSVGMNALMQVVGSKISSNLASGVNRAASLRIWNGSEPLSLSIKIPVIDDDHYSEASDKGISTNLTEALEFLGCLCLPKKGGKYGFYTPPPSPIAMTVGINSKTTTFSSTPGRIILQLGSMLMVDNCILESIQVEYPNTKNLVMRNHTNSSSVYLTPLLANVTLTISTVEAMTASTYSNMLWLKNQSGEGKGEAIINASGLWDSFAGASDKVVSAIDTGIAKISGTSNGTDGSSSPQ